MIPQIIRILSLCVFALLSCAAVHAQEIPGQFYPSVVGDIPEEPFPFRFTQPSSIPFLVGRGKNLKQELEMARRPYIRQFNTGVNQSLIPDGGQLDTMTPGVEVGYCPTLQSRLRFYYLPTVFGRAGLKSPRAFGEEYRVGYDAQPTDRFRYRLRAGLFQTVGNSFTTDGCAVIGNATGTYRIADWWKVSLGYRRDILGNTLMSAVGIKLPINGALVGRDKQNTFFVTTSFNPLPKTALSFLYGGGFVEGHKVKDNPTQQFGVYASRVLYSRDPDSHLSLVLPSYNLNINQFKYDLISQGNADLVPSNNRRTNIDRLISAAKGQTIIPLRRNQPPRSEVGGYFSPNVFYAHTIRIDLAGRLVGPVHYVAGGGLGVSVTKSITARLANKNMVGTCGVRLYAPLGKRTKIEVGWQFLQIETAYRRNLLYTQTTHYF